MKEKLKEVGLMVGMFVLVALMVLICLSLIAAFQINPIKSWWMITLLVFTEILIVAVFINFIIIPFTEWYDRRFYNF